MTNDQMQLFGGSWTEQKLAILAEYLSSYNTALKKQPFTRIYVDAFAGTGYRQQRRSRSRMPDLFQETDQDESQGFLKGSAKLALETEPAFHRYIFVESDAAKVSELGKLGQDHPDKKGCIQVIQSDANAFLRDFCTNQSWVGARAVVFIDPFATEVEWATIEAIARTQAIDVWILFPLMAVNRLLSRDSRKVHRSALGRIFGTDEWFERFYQTRREDDILGQSFEKVTKAGDFDRIRDFYLEHLRGVFAKVAEKPRVLCNSKGSPLFQLFFAASNRRGTAAEIAVRIASHLLENL